MESYHYVLEEKKYMHLCIFQIRRRRLARLTAHGNTSPSGSVSPPITPFSQSPNISNQLQSPAIFESQNEQVEAQSSSTKVELECAQHLQATPEGVFKEPSQPIDINRPSSSRSRAPPQRSDSETSSTHMEVDDVSGSVEKQTANTDIDSGFENMEVYFRHFSFTYLVLAFMHSQHLDFKLYSYIIIKNYK